MLMKRLKISQALHNDTWVRPYLHQYKRALVLALALGIATFLAASALMFTSGYLISKAATHPYNILLIYVPIVLTRAFGIARPAFKYAERLVSHNWVLKMTSKLRLKLYRTLEPDAIFVNNRYKIGDVMGLLAADINHIQDLYLRTLFPTIVGWSLYLIVVVALGWFSVPFALLMLLVLATLVVVVPLWSALFNAALQERQKHVTNALYQDLTDNVLGVSDWIFAQRSADYVMRHEHHEAQLHALKTKLNRRAYARTVMMQLIVGILVLVATWFATVKFQRSDSNYIAAFALAVFPVADAFMGLPTAADSTNIYADTLKRLNALEPSKQPAATTATVTGPLTVKLDHVSFGYSQEKQVLADLNLTLHPGEKLAVLGRSGVGKSTLAHLIRGDLRPTSGAVTYNDVPVAQLRDQIATYCGVIEQKPYLFNTTIKNNLRLANEDATDAQLWAVLKQVGLAELVKSLPHQLDTLIDSAGLRFSGGERQRLALARILLQATPIVILDEPTVGLDPITEASVMRTFMTALRDKTVIWITHHLQGIDEVDQVIFLKEGKITLHGSPAELMKSAPEFVRLKRLDAGLPVAKQTGEE